METTNHHYSMAAAQPIQKLPLHSPLTAESLDTRSQDTTVVQFINRILLDAIQQNASDIHFEPYLSDYRIRYRKDGLLNTIATPPKSLAKRIAARLKVMAELDLAEKRLPQDGSFNVVVSETHQVDCRISTCPTLAGETIVVRILDTESQTLNLESLGLDDTQKIVFLNAIHQTQGLILVTGPTGCGKTLTLYTALQRLNTVEKNISTVEDPVEIKLTGINQITINPKIDLTFSKALRALLRQDPDVIMIGEIRDLETAEIAIKAAQTGHLVLSTLHTNSAVDSITRLLNIGVLGFNLSNSIRLIIAQRLVRRLCMHCKKPQKKFTIQHDLDLKFTLETLKNASLYEANGCARCYQGYQGQIGLFELLPISESLSQMVATGKSAQALKQQAIREGMQSMYQSGLHAIQSGITSLAEVLRVISP